MSSRFLNFDAGIVWEMGWKSRKDCFLGEELLWDFAAWIDLTTNADTSIVSVCSKMRAQFGSLKRADDLRVYQGFMMSLNHQAGM